MTRISRRELLAGMLAAPVFAAKAGPTAPVAIAKCASYEEDQVALLSKMFDQLGGLDRIVKNKTVTVKLNLTGSPANKFRGMPVGLTHYSHPKQIAAFAFLANKAGARRVRFVESPWAWAGPVEEYMLDAGWNVREIKSISDTVGFENTNCLGSYKTYHEYKTADGGLIFPSYQLNKAFSETDVIVSMAKLKNHDICGVTLSMKNMFGCTPAAIYGDDSGADEPNEKPTAGRVRVCHEGKRPPSKIAAAEKDPASPRAPGYRMPRIAAELNTALPVGIAIIDGVETLAAGEGPWIRRVRHVKPGVMLVGTNALTTDTVATAVMGYNPRETGAGAFARCDNQLLLAEQLGVGVADLKNIEVRGLPIADAMFPFNDPWARV